MIFAEQMFVVFTSLAFDRPRWNTVIWAYIYPAKWFTNITQPRMRQNTREPQRPSRYLTSKVIWAAGWLITFASIWNFRFFLACRSFYCQQHRWIRQTTPFRYRDGFVGSVRYICIHMCKKFVVNLLFWRRCMNCNISYWLWLQPCSLGRNEIEINWVDERLGCWKRGESSLI